MHCEGCQDLQYLYFELCLTCIKVQLELLWHPSREGGGELGALLFLPLEKSGAYFRTDSIWNVKIF